MTNRLGIGLALALIGLVLAGCPLGRKNADLGDDCQTANDCPMGTTGLICSGVGAGGKKYCTKACTSDADCSSSKNGAMTCATGVCAFKK